MPCAILALPSYHHQDEGSAGHRGYEPTLDSSKSGVNAAFGTMRGALQVIARYYAHSLPVVYARIRPIAYVTALQSLKEKKKGPKRAGSF